MLVHQPFPLRGVRVAGADVLGLQMLWLAVNGVAPSSHRFFPLLGERQQTTEGALGLQSGTATFFLLNHTLLGTEQAF